MPKNRINKDAQPELPIDGNKGKAQAANGNGDGDSHVHIENVTIAHRPFVPGQIESLLHKRVDKSFLEYAAYVVRDRAIPKLADGLKPVQRRILWAMHESDDGRFTKVANVIGDTTK